MIAGRTLFDLGGPLSCEKSTTVNRLQEIDKSAHDWYRFVLSYPPHLVQKYLAEFQLDSRHVVLDPFCGTGTTLVECKKHGIASIGIEANPIACFASNAKVKWDVDPDGLLAHAWKIAQEVQAACEKEGIPPEGSSEFSASLPVLRTLSDEKHKLLLKNSISPLPLHRALVLLDHITGAGDAAYRDHELLALAKSLVNDIGNLHFGPEVGIGKIKTDAPVLASWLAGIEAIARDIRLLQEHPSAASRAILADSRDLLRVVEKKSIDAVITSPPYPNEKDYTRTTRLESVLLGFLDSKNDLRHLKRSLMRSNTRNVYKGDDDDQWIEDHAQIQAIAVEIEARRVQMGKTSGFERMYHKVAKLYFGGMKRHLAQLRQVLRPGAQLAYVVGDQASYLRVMIRTGQLLAGIAEDLGYETVKIDLFRTRLATATKEQLREEVIVLKWPGKQKKAT